jgi:hypothetical protein
MHFDFAAKHQSLQQSLSSQSSPRVHKTLIGHTPQSALYGGNGAPIISSHGVLIAINVHDVMERLNPEVQAEFRDGTFVSSIAAASEDSDQDTFWARDTHGSCYEFVDMVSRPV